MSETAAGDPPGPPEGRRPQRKLSDEEKQTIRDTLKRPDVANNISVCAQLLGLNYGAVEAFIRRDPYLSAMIPEKRADVMEPTEADIIDRPPLNESVLINPAEYEQYQKLMRQSRSMLKRDWEELGMTPAQGEKMERYASIGAAPIGQVIRSSHGQLIKNMMVLDEIIERDAKMILDDNLPPEFKADGSPKDPDVIRREWRGTVFAGMKLQADIFVHITRTQAMMAQAMRNLEAAKLRNSAAPRGKLSASAIPPKASTAHDAANQE